MNPILAATRVVELLRISHWDLRGKEAIKPTDTAADINIMKCDTS